MVSPAGLACSRCSLPGLPGLLNFTGSRCHGTPLPNSRRTLKAQAAIEERKLAAPSRPTYGGTDYLGPGLRAHEGV